MFFYCDRICLNFLSQIYIRHNFLHKCDTLRPKWRFKETAPDLLADPFQALGSIAIITGIFMFIDTLLLIKSIAGK
jgi:hypothetical protein